MQGKVPNQVHVFAQVPAYILLALSEILISFTGLEYASTQAPSSMKSFVMALFMSTYSIGSLLAISISPFNMAWKSASSRILDHLERFTRK
jgi:POT family proton-dependent oligopeptide transporter